MKCMLLCVLLSATFMLISCVGPFTKKNPAEIQTAETHEIWSSRFSFPNSPNVISYRFHNPEIIFDASENIQIDLSCNEDSVDILVIRSYIEWNPPPKSEKEEHYKAPYSCSMFNEFIRRLASVKPEKCVSRNAYSINSDISPTIIFTDESNTLRHVSYYGRFCAFGRNEMERTPLESIDYDLRKFIMDAGAWKNLVVNRPLRIIDNPDAVKYSMTSSLKNFDKRFMKKKQILSLNQDTSFTFVENLDVLPYFRAYIEDNRVVYELSENGKILKTSEDTDVLSFEKMLESLRSYKIETWVISASCKGPWKSFYWNDENFLNSIYFHCETEKQEVLSLRKKVEDWFKSKLNMLEENEMNTDGSKNEPGNQGIP